MTGVLSIRLHVTFFTCICCWRAWRTYADGRCAYDVSVGAAHLSEAWILFMSQSHVRFVGVHGEHGVHVLAGYMVYVYVHDVRVLVACLV